MESFYLALGTAGWLGILTSISPCPMATNVAAVTFIGRRIDRPGRVLLSGLLYTFGRTVTYVGLAALLVSSVLAVPDVAMFLQRNLNKLLGPILIVVGLLLLDLFRFTLPGLGFAGRTQEKFGRLGLWGAGLLGLLFALSFCPVSAALYFGSLLPLAVDHQSPFLLPTVYGIGTALPVVIFALLAAFGARFVGGLFNRLSRCELWARRITGVVFIGVGIYYCLIYLLRWI